MADQLWLMTRIREEEEWVDKFSWVRANSGSADRWSNGLTNSDGPVVSGSDDDDGGDDDGGGDGGMMVVVMVVCLCLVGQNVLATLVN